MLPSQGNGDGGAGDPGALAPLLDAEQAARLLNVPVSWVRSEARAKRIPHSRLGKYVRFDADELLAWAKNGQHHGPRGGR